jgi:hypothetical protein
MAAMSDFKGNPEYIYFKLRSCPRLPMTVPF